MPIAVESVPSLVALSHRIGLEVNRLLGGGAGLPAGTPDRVEQLLYVGPGRKPGRRRAESGHLHRPGVRPITLRDRECARMAWHFSKGELDVGDSFVHESVLNTMFTGTAEPETGISGRRAIIPTITGSAYITGFNQLVLDSLDPLGEGIFIPAAGAS